MSQWEEKLKELHLTDLEVSLAQFLSLDIFPSSEAVLHDVWDYLCRYCKISLHSLLAEYHFQFYSLNWSFAYKTKTRVTHAEYVVTIVTRTLKIKVYIRRIMLTKINYIYNNDVIIAQGFYYIKIP